MALQVVSHNCIVDFWINVIQNNHCQCLLFLWLSLISTLTVYNFLQPFCSNLFCPCWCHCGSPNSFYWALPIKSILMLLFSSLCSNTATDAVARCCSGKGTLILQNKRLLTLFVYICTKAFSWCFFPSNVLIKARNDTKLYSAVVFRCIYQPSWHTTDLFCYRLAWGFG